MSFLLGVVTFVVALVFSVMLHEAGHFATAKKFGMKVTQFFVGFGHTLWSFHRGETEYGIKAIPAGGFVKITGMTNLEDVEEDDEPRSFRRQPGWQRIIVLSAGSFMHFLLAAVLLFGVAVGVGLATTSTSTAVGSIDPCVPASSKATACTSKDAASPAKKAGLQAGDKIVAIAGTPVHDWNQMGKEIRRQPADAPVPITVERDGKRMTLHVSLAVIHGRPGSYLGISPVVAFQPQSPLGGLAYAGQAFQATLAGSAKILTSLPAAIPDLFAKNRASTPAGQLTSVVGVGDITGQVFAAPIGWKPKVSLVLLLVASVNIFVGLFNLLPLLPLDGGHIAIVIYERIRAWLARLRGRADPGPVDFRKLVPVSVGVFAVLIGFGLLLIMADIVNPIQIVQ